MLKSDKKLSKFFEFAKLFEKFEVLLVFSNFKIAAVAVFQIINFPQGNAMLIRKLISGNSDKNY